MQMEVSRRGLLAENQMGTVSQVQGAKEQALLNPAVNKERKNLLKTAWYDVKKAYDSVGHDYLAKRTDRLEMPAQISTFLRSIIKKGVIEHRSGSQPIMKKRVERGVSVTATLRVVYGSVKSNVKYAISESSFTDGTWNAYYKPLVICR
ncbi:hypothetical protein PAEPH01_1258 [Pancytospora epiphaga]|nr:hypothetical protein PAEPH01_1258 [Pancytospora epiphaga]